MRLLILALAVLAFPLSESFARPVKITKNNISEFENLGKRYVCRISGNRELGIINKKKLRKGVRWKSLSLARLSRSLNKLQGQVSKLEGRKSKKKQLKKKRRKLKKAERSLNSAVAANIRCLGSKTPGDEFSGDPNSLIAYGEVLSENEIQHLLNKVAFGGSDELREIGRTRGLTALVDSLVDGVMTEAEREQLRSDTLYWVGRDLYYPEENPEIGRIWTIDAAQVGQTYRFLYSREPFLEWMLLQLSAHFATNLNAIGFSYSEYYHIGIPIHWALLGQHAVGNFRELTRAMYFDPAMNFWLDNKDNKIGEPNQNYARELLELFTLGAIDPVSGVANYDEEGIAAATAYVSGYFEDRDNPAIDAETGQEVLKISYSPELHDTGSFRVFRGIPGADFSGSMTADTFLDHVLDSHPGSSRYIAERFSGMMLYPGLPEGVVQDLANTLRDNNYEFKPFLKRVLKSSAMFSDESRISCIESPIEHLTRLARRLLKNDLPRNGEEGDSSHYFLRSLIYGAGDAGQQLFEPPSVFGWKGSCNINRSGATSKGEGWTGIQALLNRSRACGQMVNMLIWREYDFLGNLGIAEGMTAKQVIQQVADSVYDMSLSPEQLAILSPHMTTLIDDESGEVTNNFPVLLEEEWYVFKKIPRLICLLGDLAEVNLR